MVEKPLSGRYAMVGQKSANAAAAPYRSQHASLVLKSSVRKRLQKYQERFEPFLALFEAQQFATMLPVPVKGLKFAFHQRLRLRALTSLKHPPRDQK